MKSKTFSKILVVALLITVFTLAVVFTACDKGALDMTNPLSSASGLKPGSYNIVVGDDGTKSYVMKDAADMPARTVNFEIPTDEDALKELAYMLYAIGNKTMVTVPYASYFETGTNSSKMMGTTLPLIFNTVDMRNNVTGERYRQTIQVVEEGADTGVLGPLMEGLSECGMRWYVKAGELTSMYQRSTKFVKDATPRAVDWSKSENLEKYPEKRLSIAVNPIPYQSSGFQGKINGQDQTPANVNGMVWVYDEATGYSIPQYVDGAGRTIGYEKTDQHIFFSTGDDANRYDGAGNLIEEDYYNTISYAEVTYNAEEGFYSVYIKMDSSKEYTHIDTAWALQDEKGAKDPTARFTKFEVKFDLWDNGYFKSWEMWEDWIAPKAHGLMEMSAVQHYTAIFSYEEDDAAFNKYYQP